MSSLAFAMRENAQREFTTSIGTEDRNGCGLLHSLGMGLGPFVSFVGPLSAGAVGETIEIFGQGLTGTTKVSLRRFSGGSYPHR